MTQPRAFGPGAAVGYKAPVADPNATPQDHRGALVCVTGASGFIASEVVRQLLERGYRVRGTVRDPKDPNKTAHLWKIADELDARDRLELVPGNLMKPGAFDAALEGARFCCHMAAAVILTAKDPQREIVDPAVHGTRNVFDAIKAAGSVEAVVMTSSISAVLDESKPRSYRHSEADWNESATVKANPYPVAKVESEREAFARVEAAAWGGDPPRLVTINPVLVLGPVTAAVHKRSSPAILRDLLTGKFPGIPNLHFGVVDVRDVARAHVNALANPNAEGRFILHNRGVHMREMAGILRAHFPGSKTPRFGLPNLLMYASAMFDKRVNFTFLRRNLGVERLYDNRRVQEVLGIEFAPIEETIIDGAKSFYELGLA